MDPLEDFGFTRDLGGLRCGIEPLLSVGFYTVLFTLASRHHFGHMLANGWAWALPFGIMIANFRGLAEHTQLWHRDPPDSFHSTRSLVSNRFIAFFFNNQNHHLEHHLFPGLPWNALGPRLGSSVVATCLRKTRRVCCQGLSLVVGRRPSLRSQPDRELQAGAFLPRPPRSLKSV